MNNSYRIPSLDGFRAVSVLIVFSSHAELSGLLPARLGVTIFFFISGYIITTLLRDEFERSQSLNFRAFYMRRVYRIFPPLYIVLAIAALLTWLGLLKYDVSLPGVLSQIFHVSNYYGILNGRFQFFQGTALLWSLAVEEHFYLVFPLSFLVLMRRMPARQVAVVLMGICVLVLLWRCYLYYGLEVRNKWAFLATDSRIDSILYGCILALWANPARDKLVKRPFIVEALVLAAAVIALAVSVALPSLEFKKTVMFTIQGIALFPIFSLAIRNPHWLVFRWLNWKPIVALGVISYTFYLSHAIAIRLGVALAEQFWLQNLLAFVITIAFSTLMYFVVEKPLGRKRAALNKLAAASTKHSSGRPVPATQRA